MKKAIFWDKDGTLVECKVKHNKPYPHHNGYNFIDGIENILSLVHNNRGYINIVITNQPDVAREQVKQEDIEYLLFDMWYKNPAIASVYVCMHDDKDNCRCRKPKTGLLRLAANRYNLDLSQCWVIGDTWRDIQAGRDAGCKTIFIDHHYDLPRPEKVDYAIDSVTNIALELEKIFCIEGIL